MTLDLVLVGFALTAGTVAFLNPCGFAMLPTYISYFIERNSSFPPTSSPTNKISRKDNSTHT